MNLDSFFLFDALALAVAAAIVDVRYQRIPNWLTYSGLLLGLALRGAYSGWKGLAIAATGALLTGGIMLVFYAVRAMGAGDVKLMAAIGAFAGPQHAPTLLIATGFFGGVLALFYAASQKRMGATLKNVGSVVRFHFLSGLLAHPQLNLDNPSALRMPYGLAIAVGTLYTFVATV